MSNSQGARTEQALQRVVDAARRWGAGIAELARHPVRLFLAAACVVLLIIAVPLLAAGGMRLDRAWKDWRHEQAVDASWKHSTAQVREVRPNDGLDLRVAFRVHGKTQTARAHVETGATDWIGMTLPIRYDPHDASRIELLGVVRPHPLGSLLIGSASIAAALGLIAIAVGAWRRRMLVEVSAHPLAALRRPLSIGGTLLVLALGAWATGTVVLEGWSGVANGIGGAFSVVFGDFLRVTVPLFAFALGCLLTAWLARYRHHERHEGLLSSAHRIIDRAAGYVPSPEELRAPKATAQESSVRGHDGDADHPQAPPAA
jgi:hypothetical protein